MCVRERDFVCYGLRKEHEKTKAGLLYISPLAISKELPELEAT